VRKQDRLDRVFGERLRLQTGGMALVTALAPKIGYAEAAKLAKEAVAKNVTVRQLVMEKGLLKGKELDEVLDLRAMTELGVPGERK